MEVVTTRLAFAGVLLDRGSAAATLSSSEGPLVAADRNWPNLSLGGWTCTARRRGRALGQPSEAIGEGYADVVLSESLARCLRSRASTRFWTRINGSSRPLFGSSDCNVRLSLLTGICQAGHRFQSCPDLGPCGGAGCPPRRAGRSLLGSGVDSQASEAFLRTHVSKICTASHHHGGGR